MGLLNLQDSHSFPTLTSTYNNLENTTTSSYEEYIIVVSRSVMSKLMTKNDKHVISSTVLDSKIE